RWLYRKFLPIGYKVGELKFNNQPIPLGLRLLYALGQFAVFAPLRDKLGLTRVRSAYTAGGTLSPDVLRFFRALGVNLKQIYGSTEVSGGATAHRNDDVKFETVGKPLPGVELKISDEGEILIKGGGIFQGYYKNPEATAKAVVDGWFHTGDAGYIDEDGHLICLGRMKELIELAGGEKYPPYFIEGSLKFSPYIREVMTVGGKQRPFVSALIAIDFDNVGRWAEKHGIAYTTYVDLSQKPEVYNLIRQDVERVNKTLPPAARVKRFVNMHKEFDPDEAELTRTRKLRRGYLEEKYHDMIDAIYRGEEHVVVRATIRYQDGREGVLETPVTIQTVEDFARQEAVAT
ncbi:MAG: long-chain fatty acid--CoA ligase, partial [Caldilineae bacterium]